MWLLKYMKAVLISFLGHNYEHEQTDRTTKPSITFSVGFLSSYHTPAAKKLLPLLCDTKSSRTVAVHPVCTVLQPIHRSIQELRREKKKLKIRMCSVTEGRQPAWLSQLLLCVRSDPSSQVNFALILLLWMWYCRAVATEQPWNFSSLGWCDTDTAPFSEEDTRYRWTVTPKGTNVLKAPARADFSELFSL